MARAEDAPKRAAVLLAAAALAREEEATAPSPASLAEHERESAALRAVLDGATLLDCRRLARGLDPASVLNAKGDWTPMNDLIP